MARRLSRQMSTPGENEDRKENNHDFSFEPMEQWEGGVVVGGVRGGGATTMVERTEHGWPCPDE